MIMLIILGYVLFAVSALFTFIDFIRYVNKKLDEKN
jgi:lipopolysaccharide export LptBFGC system permease protein LptF